MSTKTAAVSTVASYSVTASYQDVTRGTFQLAAWLSSQNLGGQIRGINPLASLIHNECHLFLFDI